MRRQVWLAMLLSVAGGTAFARTTSIPVDTSSPHVSARPACAAVEPPQALTTPDPLLTSSVSAGKVKVSFIIGTDGRVHSPLILESAGIAGDRRVLQTVRTWRYRPATCNGVPTETEGKVEFSSR
jgi:TonB family protein